jgi:hypothetical protein
MVGDLRISGDTQIPYTIMKYIGTERHSIKDLSKMPYLNEYGIRTIRYWIRKMSRAGQLDVSLDPTADMRTKLYRYKPPAVISESLSPINAEPDLKSTVI